MALRLGTVRTGGAERAASLQDNGRVRLLPPEWGDVVDILSRGQGFVRQLPAARAIPGLTPARSWALSPLLPSPALTPLGRFYWSQTSRKCL